MAAIGGSIESITLNGRIFPIAADAESNRKLGGFENEVMANGDGGARLIKTRVPLSLDGLAVVTDDSRGDQEYLQDFADLKDFGNIGINYVSGQSYTGRAQIVNEIQGSSQNATTPITLHGPGRLERL